MNFIHSTMMNGGIKSRPARTKPWQLFLGLAVIVIIVLAATSSSSNVVKDNLAVVTGTGTQTAINTNENLCSVTKPMQITAFNAYSGAALNAPQVEIRSGSAPHGLSQNVSASSSGVVTTASAYTSGTPLKVMTYAASTVRQWLDVTVPPMTCGDNSTNNVMSIYAIVLGAWTATVTGTGGTTFTDGTIYNISEFTADTVDISFTLSETTANAGYRTSFDPIRNAYYGFVIEVSTTGNSLSITGFQKSAVKGSTTYYFKACPDGVSGTGFGKTGGQGQFQVKVGTDSQGYAQGCTGSLSAQTIGTDVIGGTASFTFTVAQGALASGSSQNLDTQWRRNADINKFINENDYGAYDAQVGSTFDLDFRATP